MNHAAGLVHDQMEMMMKRKGVCEDIHDISMYKHYGMLQDFVFFYFYFTGFVFKTLCSVSVLMDFQELLQCTAFMVCVQLSFGHYFAELDWCGEACFFHVCLGVGVTILQVTNSVSKKTCHKQLGKNNADCNFNLQ